LGNNSSNSEQMGDVNYFKSEMLHGIVDNLVNENGLIALAKLFYISMENVKVIINDVKKTGKDAFTILGSNILVVDMSSKVGGNADEKVAESVIDNNQDRVALSLKSIKLSSDGEGEGAFDSNDAENSDSALIDKRSGERKPLQLLYLSANNLGRLMKKKPTL